MAKAPRPSLWSDLSFNAIDFSRHLLSFREDFPSDYESLNNESPSYLVNLLEVEMLR